MIPANAYEALMVIGPIMINTRYGRRHLVLPSAVGHVIVHRTPSGDRSACWEAGRTAKWLWQSG